MLFEHLDFVKIHLKPNRTKLDWQTEILLNSQLRKYEVTESVHNLIQDLNEFCKQEYQQSSRDTVEFNEDMIQIDEHTEILQLRHLNISKL